MRRNFLKRILTYCTKCNETNVCHLVIQKHVTYEKWFKYYMFFVYKFTQRLPNTLRPMGGILKHILANIYCTKYNEINTFFEMYNSRFHIQGLTKNFGYIMGYALKRMEMYF